MPELYKEKPIVRLRAFRAIDDHKSCELFIEGHTHVLKSIGVTKVTSSKYEWMHNPASFVLIVESINGQFVYGGARVNVAGGTQPLPIEEATGLLDPKIFKIIKDYANLGTGEICGLWNSREIAGYGIGSIFLTRAAVAISSQIGLQSLFALCAPYTVSMAELVGYEHEKSVGNKGTFYYPKLDLVATAMVLKDVNQLSKATEEDRNAIFTLRKKPNTIRKETLRKKEIEIHYSTMIPNLKNWSIAETIKASQNVDYNNSSNANKTNFI